MAIFLEPRGKQERLALVIDLLRAGNERQVPDRVAPPDAAPIDTASDTLH
jgi:hypothetical protein